jgi:hypothetical protein
MGEYLAEQNIGQIVNASSNTRVNDSTLIQLWVDRAHQAESK